MVSRKRGFKFLDLFSGAGGFTEGFLLADHPESEFRLVAASDVNHSAELTHVGRFREQIGIDYAFLCKNIRDEDFLESLTNEMYRASGATAVDVIIGGPPCQGFSVFGKRDEADPRNDLFRPYLNVIAALSPKYFIMENVPGLAMMYGGKMPKLIRETVEKVTDNRYHVAGPITVNAADFGVPQARERVIFVGYRTDVVPPNLEFQRRPQVNVGEAISDLSFLRCWEASDSYHPSFPAVTQYQVESRRGRLFAKYGIPAPERLHNHEAAKHSPEVIARFAMIEKGKGLDSIPRDLWDAHLSTSKKWCVRLDDAKPSNTVVTLPDDFVHYSQHRVPTVREMARLQSFDDTFVFQGPRTTGGGGAGNKKRLVELPQYTQVGNAVPPLMARALAEMLLSALSATRTQEDAMSAD